MDGYRKTTPGSAGVLRALIGDIRKLVGFKVGRAKSLVDMWVADPPSAKNPESTGVANPIDMIVSLLWLGSRADGHSIRDAHKTLDWLCRQFGGRFVPQDGGRGDGKLFRDLGDALPHLKALTTEIKKKDGTSLKVLKAHLDEVFVIITSNLADTKTTEDSHE